MKNTPLLSIITPVYNTEEYLPLCIESVINQDYQNWELILVNDGSIDNSLAVCQTYADTDKRIKVFSQENQGASVARNLALDKAKGEIITFLDSDDAIDACSFDLMVKTLEEHSECDQVQIAAHWNYTSPQYFYFKTVSPSIIDKEDMLRKWVFENKIGWCVWGGGYKSSLFDEVRFLPGILFEDNVVKVQLLLKSKGICFSDEDGTGYRYYIRDEQSEKWEWPLKKRVDYITSHGEIVKLFLEHYPYYSEFRCEFYRRIVNSVWIAIRGDGLSHPVVKTAIPYLKEFRLRDLFRHNRLDLKAKFKITLIKTIAYFL